MKLSFPPPVPSALAASEVDGKKVGGRAPEMLKALQDALVADYIEETNV